MRSLQLRGRGFVPILTKDPRIAGRARGARFVSSGVDLMPGSRHLLFRRSSRPQRLGAVAKLSGLGLILAFGYGLGWTTPAAAAPGDWRAGCQFKNIPGGAADGIRYDACMHQRDCQQLANAAGHRIVGSGCFWVSPEQEEPSTQRPAPPPPPAR